MSKKTIAVLAAMLMTLGLMGGAALASHSTTMLEPFTQAELDTWEADRQFPTGGVSSVTAFGRDDVARIGIDSAATETNTFRRTEGITTDGDFEHGVQVDLYVDPDWADTAVRAGFWVVGDDGADARDDWFGIIEFVNLEPSEFGESTEGDHEGWRIWDSENGWTDLDTDVTYGEWATLTITLDTDDQEYAFAIDGEEVGSGPAGEHFIREVFLNSYNYGLDGFPNLDTDSYAAHWHAGLAEVDDKDECRDGAWEETGFRNQGQCIRFVTTGKDSR